ncbi:MAG: hypothetical protein AAGF07_05560 [Patescibacteria group bacterium]
MPRKTYGPQVKKRVKRLLEALLCYVNGEFDDYGFDIKHNNWIEEDTNNPELTVETTLVTLELLTQKDKYDGKLTKSQIRDALKLLDKKRDDSLLKILKDNRTIKQGSENWHFTLTLWSKDKEENLKQFDKVWEINRPLKSKALEESSKLDKSGTNATLSSDLVKAKSLLAEIKANYHLVYNRELIAIDDNFLSLNSYLSGSWKGKWASSDDLDESGILYLDLYQISNTFIGEAVLDNNSILSIFGRVFVVGNINKDKIDAKFLIGPIEHRFTGSVNDKNNELSILGEYRIAGYDYGQFKVEKTNKVSE